MKLAIPMSAAFVLALCLSLSSSAAADDGRTAKEIIDTMVNKDSMAFDEGYGVVEMVIENKRGKQRIRKVETKGKKVDGLGRFVLTFLEPDDVAGTQMLSIERKGEDDLQYLYLASMKETRKIAGADKNDNFMGTDFTFADMEQRDVEDAAYERLADTEVSKIPAYHIIAKPNAGTSEYSKLEMWIDQQDHLPLKIYYYDKKDQLLKKLIAKRIEPKGGKPTITKLLMMNVQKGSRTTLNILQLERGAKVPDGIFDPDALGK
ncbi:MAG: outer membrane lipoprotein-sorting protein [Pseudomonadota bacterium]